MPSMSACGRRFIPASVSVPTVGRKSAKLEGNVDAIQSVSFQASVTVSSGEVKALIVIDRL